MSKQRRTVSLDPTVDEYLSREGVNASELLNSLAEAHITAGGDEAAMLRLREQQLQSEIDELQSRIETKARELEQVRDQLSDQREQRAEIIQDARNTLCDTPLEPENPAVEKWAAKAEMGVSEFIDAVQEGAT